MSDQVRRPHEETNESSWQSGPDELDRAWCRHDIDQLRIASFCSHYRVNGRPVDTQLAGRSSQPDPRVVSVGRAEPLTHRAAAPPAPSTDTRARSRASARNPATAGNAREATVTYLIVGLDRKTYTKWHENVFADDIGTAKQIARSRATARGIDLVVAAVIGPNSAVLSDPAEERAARSNAA